MDTPKGLFEDPPEFPKGYFDNPQQLRPESPTPFDDGFDERVKADLVSTGIARAMFYIENSPFPGTVLGAQFGLVQGFTAFLHEIGIVDDELHASAAAAFEDSKLVVQSLLDEICSTNNSGGSAETMTIGAHHAAGLRLAPQAAPAASTGVIAATKRRLFNASFWRDIPEYLASLKKFVAVRSEEQLNMLYHILTKLAAPGKLFFDVANRAWALFDLSADTYTNGVNRHFRTWMPREEVVEYATLNAGAAASVDRLLAAHSGFYGRAIKTLSDAVYLSPETALAALGAGIVLLAFGDYQMRFVPAKQEEFLRLNNEQEANKWRGELLQRNEKLTRLFKAATPDLKKQLNRRERIDQHKLLDGFVKTEPDTEAERRGNINRWINEWVQAINSSEKTEIKMEHVNESVAELQKLEYDLTILWRDDAIRTQLDMWVTGRTGFNGQVVLKETWKASLERLDFLLTQKIEAVFKYQSRFAVEDYKSEVARLIDNLTDTALAILSPPPPPPAQPPQQPAAQAVAPNQYAGRPGRRQRTRASTVDTIVDQFLACRMGK